LQQIIKAGSVSLFCEEEGGGPPILFVHGIPTDYRAWKSQIAEFSKDFRAISYSRRIAFPNENALEATESTIEKNSEDLRSLIQELKADRLTLVGHSYGGFVSLFTAWKLPELIQNLVLVEPAAPSILVKNEKNPLEVISFLFRNPAAATSARRFQNGKLRAALRAYESGDYKNGVKNFYEGIRERDGAFDQAPQYLQEMMVQNGRTLGELETTFPVFTREDAKKITIPTLLVKGGNSPKWLTGIVDALGQSMRNSTVVEIPRSGHLPHIDNPQDFNSALRQFVQKNAMN
jgi:non-heme chloroperoxidase